MNHLIVAPIILPAVAAALALLGRHRSLSLGRMFSMAACLALLLIAMALMVRASDGSISVYALGGWQAPFGIVLMLDRLSAMMLMITSLLAAIVLFYAIVTGLDKRGWHFHPLFHFQLLGLNGAFLTGDLFNLFVFFEVLLIASYGLMLHAPDPARLKAGVHYVIVNLVGSTIFLVAIGILYGITGTLNMADLAVRIAALPAGDQGLVRAGVLLLIVVFGLKAALLPLHLWLPGTYANTSPAVAALFAVMTKVGVYSIIRVVTLIFGTDAGLGAWAPGPWLFAASILTIVIGFVGLLAAGRLRELSAFAIIGSTGTLLATIALFERDAMAAALYYLPHSTFAGAALFLVSGAIGDRRPGIGGTLATGPRFAEIELLSVLFLLSSIALVGLPPLSGFVGKLLILDAATAHPAAAWLWTAILVTTLLGIVGLARAGSVIFWKSAATDRFDGPAVSSVRLDMVAPAAILLLLAALTVWAGPATSFAEAASAQLFDSHIYVEAVLHESGRT